MVGYIEGMEEISNKQVYLERMSKPLQEKLRIARFIPTDAKNVLDVGCADGTVTLALADMFPEIEFVGIDLDKEFIEIARSRIGKRKNIKFESGFLRERLANPERFDCVTFCSVLHEFYSYGEGISTVVKALADAHEILNKHGVLIIRDMILFEYVKHADLSIQKIIKKIKKNEIFKHLADDFERAQGELSNVKNVNHFLLKYMYGENWEREVKENYVPVSFEQYDEIFKLLGMKLQFTRMYTIPYLKSLWKEDFGLTDDELENFKSTGMIVAEKG